MRALNSFFPEVLDFINQDRNSHSTGLGRLGNGHEQFGKVDFQIAGVGASFLRLQIDAYGQVLEGEFDRSYKALEHGQSALDFVFGPFHPIQFVKQISQSGNEQKSECLVLVGFHKNRLVAQTLGLSGHRIQKNGFPDATESCKEEALFGFPLFHPAKKNLSLAQNLISTNQI